MICLERDLWNNYENNTRDHCYIYKHGLLFIPNRRHKYITARSGFILYNTCIRCHLRQYIPIKHADECGSLFCRRTFCAVHFAVMKYSLLIQTVQSADSESAVCLIRQYFLQNLAVHYAKSGSTFCWIRQTVLLDQAVHSAKWHRTFSWIWQYILLDQATQSADSDIYSLPFRQSTLQHKAEHTAEQGRIFYESGRPFCWIKHNKSLNYAVHSAKWGSTFCLFGQYILLNETEHSAESSSTFCRIRQYSQTVHSAAIGNRQKTLLNEAEYFLYRQNILLNQAE